MTRYFTFGQAHCHKYGLKTVDKDTVMKITAKDPRAVMIELFGHVWAFEYAQAPDKKYWPNGYEIIEVVR